MTVPIKGGRPRLPNLAELKRQQSVFEAQNNNNGGSRSPYENNNLSELKALFKLKKLNYGVG